MQTGGKMQTERKLYSRRGLKQKPANIANTYFASAFTDPFLQCLRNMIAIFTLFERPRSSVYNEECSCRSRYTDPFVQHNYVDAEIKAADPKYYPEGTARKKAQKRVNYF